MRAGPKQPNRPRLRRLRAVRLLCFIAAGHSRGRSRAGKSAGFPPPRGCCAGEAERGEGRQSEPERGNACVARLGAEARLRRRGRRRGGRGLRRGGRGRCCLRRSARGGRRCRGRGYGRGRRGCRRRGYGRRGRGAWGRGRRAERRNLDRGQLVAADRAFLVLLACLRRRGLLVRDPLQRVRGRVQLFAARAGFQWPLASVYQPVPSAVCSGSLGETVSASVILAVPFSSL